MPKKLNRLTRVAAVVAAMSIVVMFLLWNPLPASAKQFTPVDADNVSTPLVDSTPQTVTNPGSGAEWDTAEVILVHTPGEELFVGQIHPEAALFEDSFSIKGAAEEHEEYVNKLRDGFDFSNDDDDVRWNGAEVYKVFDVLQKEGKLDDLRNLALKLTKLEFDGICAADVGYQAEYFQDNLERLQDIEPSILVRMVLEQPTITLRYAEGEGCADGAPGAYNVVADYQVDPLMNMYFTRDQIITTPAGVVIGRMNKEPRRNETEIIKLILENLGIEPLYEIQEGGFLEGGDFIPAGEQVFIGQGQRTNYNAIHQMLDADVFGVNKVVVVKDSWQNQQEMHLDTYFNIASETVAVLEADRNVKNCEAPPPSSGTPNKCLKADIWRRLRSTSPYELSDNDTDVDFVTLMEDELKFTIIPASVNVQKAYGINFLTLEGGQIIGVECHRNDEICKDYYEEYEEYKRALGNEGVNAEWIDFDNMKLGYGAAHCTTQVLRRSGTWNPPTSPSSSSLKDKCNCSLQ